MHFCSHKYKFIIFGLRAEMYGNRVVKHAQIDLHFYSKTFEFILRMQTWFLDKGMA